MAMTEPTATHPHTVWQIVKTKAELFGWAIYGVLLLCAAVTNYWDVWYFWTFWLFVFGFAYGKLLGLFSEYLLLIWPVVAVMTALYGFLPRYRYSTMRELFIVMMKRQRGPWTYDE